MTTTRGVFTDEEYANMRAMDVERIEVSPEELAEAWRIVENPEPATPALLAMYDRMKRQAREEITAETRAALAIGEGLAERHRRLTKWFDGWHAAEVAPSMSTNIPRDALEASRMIKLVPVKR